MRQINLIFFLFFSLAINGQDGFIQKYDFNRPGALISDMILDGDSLIVCGLIFPEEPPLIQGFFFSKMDTLGNVHTFKTHFDSLERDFVVGGFPSSIIKVEDQSGYILLGGFIQGANGLAIKLNNYGELIWNKEYSDNLSLVDHYRKIIEVDDGFLISGTKQALNGSNNVFIKKINHEGEQLWEELYGVGNNRRDFLGDFITKNENEFIVGGSTYPEQGVPWQQTQTSIQIFAIDSLGNQKWYWESDYALEELMVRGLNFDDEGNWIYATARGEYTFDGNLRVQPKFMIRDSSFNIVEEKILGGIGGTSANFLVDLMHISSGGWLGVGSKIDSTESVDIDGHIAAWTIRFTETGDSIWERTDEIFPDSVLSTFQYLNSAVELSSGSIIAAGYYKDNNSNVKDYGILVKVDKNGCMDTLFCTPITSLSNQLFLENEIKAFPNPTDNQISFISSTNEIWDKIEVFDFSGKILMTKNNQITINIQRLVSGIYLAKIWKDGKYKFEKVIKN